MTYTQHTGTAHGEDEDTTGVDTSRFTRPTLALGAVVLASNVGGQIFVSLSEDEGGVWTNVASVVVASLLFGVIAFALAHWAMRGTTTRRVRTTVGLGVLAVVLAPVAWWSSAPVLVGLQAWLLGRVTGVGARGGASTAARAASITAAAVAAGLLVFVWTVIIAEQL